MQFHIFPIQEAEEETGETNKEEESQVLSDLHSQPNPDRRKDKNKQRKDQTGRES